MRRSLLVVPLAALLVAGCNVTEVADRMGGEYRRCSGPTGAVTDVAREPDWRRWADHRPWTTMDGCLLRIDVLADRPGPEHCGFESARVITTGAPVGARYTGQGNAAVYVRDPANVFEDASTATVFDPDAKLPVGAVDTGFRHVRTELWIDPADRSFIYLVRGSSVERWPLDPEPALCA